MCTFIAIFAIIPQSIFTYFTVAWLLIARDDHDEPFSLNVF